MILVKLKTNFNRINCISVGTDVEQQCQVAIKSRNTSCEILELTIYNICKSILPMKEMTILI